MHVKLHLSLDLLLDVFHFSHSAFVLLLRCSTSQLRTIHKINCQTNLLCWVISYEYSHNHCSLYMRGRLLRYHKYKAAN